MEKKDGKRQTGNMQPTRRAVKPGKQKIPLRQDLRRYRITPSSREILNYCHQRLSTDQTLSTITVSIIRALADYVSAIVMKPEIAYTSRAAW